MARAEQPCFPFVVGCWRSGTTLLRLMLNANPELAIPNESHFIPRLGEQWKAPPAAREARWKEFARALAADSQFQLWELDGGEVTNALRAADPATYADAIRCVYALYARSRGKERYGDKTPSYVQCVPMLADLFPESRFVHIVRDGRDATLSILEQEFGGSGLDEAALEWVQRVRRGRRAGRRLGPARYLEVRYESLVARPADELSRICRFLDLEFDEAMLRYFETADSALGRRDDRRRRHHPNVYRPPTPGLRDWREQMHPDQIVAFEAIAGDALEEFGYPTTVARFSMTQSARARRAQLGFQLARVRGRLSMKGKRAPAAARSTGMGEG